MVHHNQSLIFPRLVFSRETNFKSWSGKDTTPIYRLGWEIFDEQLFAKHAAAESRITSRLPIPFTHALPEKWDNWVNHFEYVIPQHCLKEIHRTAFLAFGEWGMERGFDTVIREMCLGPAIAFVNVAFSLIADCAYDKETNYFYRKEDKAILKNVLMYRFWGHQTGRGCRWFNADLHDWDARLLKYRSTMSTCKLIEDFLNDITEFEKEDEKVYNMLYNKEEGKTRSQPIKK